MSTKSSTFRNRSPSHSPLSPTIIHYRHHHRRKQKQSSLNSLWEVHRSSKGQIYYYNVVTDRSQWEKPAIEQSSSLITKKSKRSTSTSTFDSHNDVNSIHFRRSWESKSKSSFKKFREGKRHIDQIELSTPISPPPSEKIHIDLVDPVPTPSNSTINAILELEHSRTTNSNSDHITRYYRAELIEHLLNWPSTQIEREAIRLSNEQIRHTTYRLTSLRADLIFLRLRLQQNHFQLLKYHHILANHRNK